MDISLSRLIWQSCCLVLFGYYMGLRGLSEEKIMATDSSKPMQIEGMRQALELLPRILLLARNHFPVKN